MTTIQPDNQIASSIPASQTHDDSWLSRITVEQLIYALLALIPLALRLVDLGLRPLSPIEASTALRAWQISRGLAPTLDAGTPLLLSLDTATFFLTGASDGLARIWPLLASVAIVVAIYQWRDWVGRQVALGAAALVAFSPLVNAFGRRGDGAAFVLLALAITLAGWGRLANDDAKGWMWLAVGLGLLVIGGPAAPTALLALAIVLLLTRRVARPLSSVPASAPVTFLAVAMLGGTIFLTHLSGLGLMALNWSDWLAAFSLSPSAWLWGLLRLLLDEPLITLLGLAGIALLARRAARESDKSAGAVWAFGIAGLVAAVVAILQGPYAPGSRAVAALMLAVPAAYFLWRLCRHLDWKAFTAEMALYTIVLAALIVLAVLALISYSATGQTTQLWLLIATLAMAVVLTLAFLYVMKQPEILTVAVVVLVAALAVFNFATAAGLAFDARSPRFPALYEKDARPGVYDLVVTAGDVSEREQGYRWALPVALVTGSEADDLLQWYLRQSPELRTAEQIGLENAPPLVVAPADRALPLSERYAGQDFAILDAWDPAQGDFRQKIAWVLFRTAPWDIPTENHILWADTQVLSLE
jgi:hypothetical protein